MITRDSLTVEQVALAMCNLVDELVAEHGIDKLITPSLLESIDHPREVVEGMLGLATELWDCNKQALQLEEEKAARPKLTLVEPTDN